MCCRQQVDDLKCQLHRDREERGIRGQQVSWRVSHDTTSKLRGDLRGFRLRRQHAPGDGEQALAILKNILKGL